MKDCSYGIVPFKYEGREWHVFLVQHRQGHWSLPKGHPETGETPTQTAARELREETGLEIDEFLSEVPLFEEYRFKSGKVLIEKKVGYFPATVKGAVHIQQDELREGSWFSLENSFKKLTFFETRNILEKSSTFLSFDK